MIVFSHFGGYGDALLVQSIAQQKAKETPEQIGVAHPYPELAQHLKGIQYVARSPKEMKRKHVLSRILFQKITEIPLYYSYFYEKHKNEPMHILTWMSEQAQLKKPVAYPMVQQEKNSMDLISQLGLTKNNYIVVQAQAKKDAPQKQYPTSSISSIISRLNAQIQTVQIGSMEDANVGASLDLRGKTSINELIQVLSESSGLLGLIGFPMHLQAGLRGKAVILYGGSELPSQSGYAIFDNMVTETSCSPCWSKSCPYELECMKSISEERVYERCMNMIGAKQ